MKMIVNQGIFLWSSAVVLVFLGCSDGSCPTLPSGFCFTDCSQEDTYYRIVCENVNSKILHDDLMIFAGLEANFSLRIWNSPDIVRLGGNIFTPVANYVVSFEMQNLQNLRMLPEVGDMRNLMNFSISGTPLLQFLPLEALPSSLINIQLYGTGITQFVVDEKNFTGLPVLKSFTIKAQTILYIANFFISFPSLEVVEISQCNLSVSRTAFTRTPLKVLRVTDNIFRTSDKSGLDQIFMRLLAHVIVDENTVMDLSGNGLTMNRQTIEKLRTLFPVKSLSLRGNTFDDYTTLGDVLHKFDNIKMLDLAYTQLPSGMGGAFSGLSELEILRLNGNSLRTLLPTTQLFQGITSRNLSVLQMSNCDLRTLPGGLSDVSVNLLELTLSRNRLTDRSFLDVNIHGWFPKLRKLELSSNSMTKFAGKAVSSMTSLRSLDISCNLFSVITPELFSGLPDKLEVLNLSFCGKKENERPKIGQGAFDYFPPIRTLWLGGGFFKGNILMRLQEMPAESLAKLEELHLPNNRIAYLDSKGMHFLGFTGLRHLDLSSNRLQSIDGSCFFHLSKLQYLNLANNAIFAIGAKDFFSLTGLRYLDLSGNNIFDIAKGAFDAPKNLTGLFLADNNITDPLSFFTNGGKRLIHLDLTNLPIPCVNPKLFIQYRSIKWLYLNDSVPLFVDFDPELSPLTQILKTPIHPWARMRFCGRRVADSSTSADQEEHSFLRIDVPDPSGSIYQFLLAGFATCYNPSQPYRQLKEKLVNMICPS